MAEGADKKPTPPPPGGAPPPPPPPTPAPAAPPKPAPAAPPKPAPAAPPKRGPPSAKPKARRPKSKPKRSRQAPKKGKPGQPPIGKKKGGRIKIKLGLRAKKISDDTDTYTDQIGWTTSGSETVLSDLKDIEEIERKKEPETITHHCSMCGIRMQIPRPTRERYKVVCAYPECGHEDKVGF